MCKSTGKGVKVSGSKYRTGLFRIVLLYCCVMVSVNRMYLVIFTYFVFVYLHVVQYWVLYFYECLTIHVHHLFVHECIIESRDTS